MKTRKKDFDCVEMKRKGARKVHEAIKGMTVEEEVAYWRVRTEEALKKYPKMREMNPSNDTAK
jgi:hypothetical protein